MILIILRRWKLLRFGGPGPGCGGTGVRFSLAVERVAVVGKGRGSRLALGGGSGKRTSVWNGFCKRLWSIKGPTECAYFFYILFFYTLAAEMDYSSIKSCCVFFCHRLLLLLFLFLFFFFFFFFFLLLFLFRKVFVVLSSGSSASFFLSFSSLLLLLSSSSVFGLNKILFTHRNHKLNKQVQETQKQYAYLSVTYI